MRTAKPVKLVQGVDYYMEGDKLVFTANYHMKRGFCCNHGCRHCPYSESETAKMPTIRILGLPGKLR